MPRRLLVPALAAAMVVTSACSAGESDDGPDPAGVAADLAEGLTSGDLGEVPFAGGEQPQSDLDNILAGMDGLDRTTDVSGVVRDGEGRATVTLRWTWTVDDESWPYSTTADLELVDDAWVVRWEPTMVEKSLRQGTTLDAVTRDGERGRILGRGGRALVKQRPVWRIGIDRSQVPAKRAAESARALAGLADIDVKSYVKQVKASGDQAFVQAIVYRRSEVPAAVKSGYRDIKGAYGFHDTLPLAPTSEFAAPILGRVGEPTAEMVEEDPELQPGQEVGVSGLQARYQDLLGGSSSARVDAVAKDGKKRELFATDGGPGKDLRISLDERLQNQAQDALADVGPAASLVAIQPSSGEILAAADGPGTDGADYSTYGRFAPGSTFKVVTALALLRSGLTPESTVSCEPSVVVDGKRFENYDDYPSGALGQVSLETAFANSCNTAFITAGEKLGPKALAEAAASLGVGIDHDLGFPAFLGSVEEATGETDAAAQRIGQGTVLASPMSMATVMASVQAGETVVPRLVDPEQVESIDVDVPDEVEPLTGAEAKTLQQLTGAVVTSGSGSFLSAVPGEPVRAKTGTAEFDRDGERLLHAWMVAAQGDLAVAVFVDEGESGSQTAGPILQRFLTAASTG